MEDLDFAAFVNRIKEKTEIDLSQYKEVQMKRRLMTLRQKHGFSSFAAYMNALEKDGGLMNEFLDRMTINVSEFWRNPGRWEAVEKRFLPEMLQADPHRRIKLWSAACSTGEEPYTLAMIASELGALERTSILATDIDRNVLQKAAQGIYRDRAVRDVPQTYLNAYIQMREPDSFAVDDKLKRAVSFQQQNLLQDKFDSGFDLIVCRNVMIYFTEDAKRELYRKFSQALRPGGILFVGSTEQIFSPSQFGLESVETFFYRRRA
ncbi:CheR family methyltransferase [Paenibacillus humicola]|uniref:CheR family methyltransferase n=1 Tax=Paenibacillus humicola TaxID=3110540 RepID=UPI00237A84D6|nr:protein-glutamate O-methyltransferase CheR [Paenibacillus humicola]